MKTGLLILIVCGIIGFSGRPAGEEPIAKASYEFKTNAQGGLLVVLDGSKSQDPDGYIATYEWKQMGFFPNPVKFNNPKLAVTTAAPSYWVLGTYKFQLTVTDDQGASNTSEITVKVVSGGSKE